MIDPKEVQQFFDRLAPGWDADMVRNDALIRLILDGAGVGPGKSILDVACGTGVLIPDYLARGASSVTAVDLSPEMVKIAREKFPQENVSVLCGDASDTDFGRRFDCIVIYNAFPHFADPEKLISHLAGFLKPGGTLTVAHGASREMIDAHHGGSARRVSNGLMTAEELAALFGKYLTVSVVISDDKMYQVTGVK
jgi:demethylmenaquinone methyltransferase/2-methoxy-6-polyprenyl-1,4-benzoquinol methylase